MKLRIYNTLTGKVEPFKPRVEGKVGMYVCGPTVYDYSHIGHARSYLAFDVIVRYLRYSGYDVKYIVNITNIDDKIINRAEETGVNPTKLAERFEKVFYNDMEALGIIKADEYPKVSDHISEIIEMINTLIVKGFAYEVDGDVYFNVNKLEDYGKLSHQTMDAIQAGIRVEMNERKRNPADFALWKRSKKGEPSWESPWGEGRPGWHIECSAMSRKYLGDQFDIHGGGRDLIFPHHENEITQSETYSGKKPFARYWLHTGFLTINGEKMSKSLGNFITIKDLLDKWEPEEFRIFILSAHYRSPINFSNRALEHEKRSLIRIYNNVNNLRMQIEDTREGESESMIEDELKSQTQIAKSKILQAMDEDFNTPKALAEFYGLIKIGNKAIAANASKTTLSEILDTIMDVSQFFGILNKEMEKRDLPEEIHLLMKERDLARRRKDWEKADQIRADLKERGIILEDHPEGTKWRFQK